MKKFFDDQESGVWKPNTIPLPDGVTTWYHTVYRGVDGLTARLDNQLYMLYDTDVFGYGLFRFVSKGEGENIFKAPLQDNVWPISRKEVSNMASGLDTLAGRFQSMQNMNLGGYNMGNAAVQTAPVVANTMPVTGEGISGQVSDVLLKSQLLANSYIAGYVMANAPALTMSLSRKKTKTGHTADIVAKESKPSRCLGIFVTFPRSCAMRGGVLARPEDIKAGTTLDYNPQDKGMIHRMLPINATKAYIDALGGKIAEYAPTVVAGAREQWKPQEILEGASGVSFVYLYPSAARSKSANAMDRFNFNMKTTSGRRSLYTENNVVCLRALEHISTRCNSEEDAYKVNQAAFGHWKYQKKKTDVKSSFQRACDECPSQIWEKKYEINGETVDGIGSSAFMAGNTIISGSNEEILRKTLLYYPWYQTGDRRPAMGSPVERIVKRSLRPQDGDKKEAMVTTPILMKDNPGHKLFAPYQKFMNMVVEEGYISREALVNLGSRSSRAKSRTLKFTPEQQECLNYFVRSEAVEAEIAAVLKESGDRAALSMV